jgi:hypothetical protein
VFEFRREVEARERTVACQIFGPKNRSSLTSEGAVRFLFQELPLKALLKGLLLRLSTLVIYSKRNGFCVLISKGSRSKREDSCLPNFRPKKSIQLNFRGSSRISIPRVEGSSAETKHKFYLQPCVLEGSSHRVSCNLHSRNTNCDCNKSLDRTDIKQSSTCRHL